MADEPGESAAGQAAWDALESGDPRAALDLLAKAARAGKEPAEADAIAALAWLDLGDGKQAQSAVARAAARLDADDPDLLFARAEVELAHWRLEAAERDLLALVRVAPDFPTGWLRLCLVHDLLGRPGEADSAQRSAHGLDPEAIHAPRHLSPAAFERIVDRAAKDLPPEFQRVLASLPVVIDPVPDRALAAHGPLDLPADLLGLFVGRSALEGHPEASGEAPPTIYLFQRNLERRCPDDRELEEEIRVTLYHELGHALGFDEEGVEAMGLG